MNGGRSLIHPVWMHGEGFPGYVARLFQANGVRANGPELNAMRRSCHLTSRAEVTCLVTKTLDRYGIEGYEDALLAWLHFRTDQSTGNLIPLLYRPAMTCIACLKQYGFRPALWDLAGFNYCPIHLTWLNRSREQTKHSLADNSEEQRRTALSISMVLASCSREWLPNQYASRMPACGIVAANPAEGYQVLAALILLNNELDQRRRGKMLPTKVADAISFTQHRASDLTDWLLPSIEALEKRLLEKAQLSGQSPPSWGWSPYMLRLHQVSSWLAQQISSTTVLALLNQLKTIATQHCFLEDGYLAGHGHAERLPDLEELGVLCPNGFNALLQEGGTDYLRLYARLHGIPALGYGPGGIVIRKEDSVGWIDVPIGYGRCPPQFFTHEAPVWCEPA